MATGTDDTDSTVIELPDGFAEASDDVKIELLESRRSEELVAAIRAELGRTGKSSPQLNKRDKAAIIVALRNLR